MNRGKVSVFFVFVFLFLIIILQISSMIQSDKIYMALNKIEEFLERTPTVIKSENEPVTSLENAQYPGQEGDWLVWAMRVEPKTLNQINVDSDIYSRWITLRNIYEPLMVYDFDNVKLKPLLAQSYEISKDGLEITFYLRNDVYFSDGVPITADDVLFTYNTVIDPNVDAANLSNLYVDVDRAEKINDKTIKFYMKRPYFKALEVLSFWDIGIYPKHIYKYKDAKQFNHRISNPIGSGPYLFERWDTGNEIVLRKNENYWGAKPRIKKIVYKFITNPIAAIQSQRAHKIDLTIPEPDQFADLVADKDFNNDFDCLTVWSPGVPFYYIGWNQDRPYFSDPRVRLAMTLSINRDQIVNHLIKGYGKIITGSFYINSSQNDSAIKPLPYDIEKAKNLLDEAGWSDHDGDGIRDKNGIPFRFKFLYSVESDVYTRLASFLKDEFIKIGADLIPDPYEWSVLVPKISDRQFDAMVMGWGGDIVEDFYQIFHSSQIGNRGSNYVGFRNAQADDLLEKIRVTIEPEQSYILCHRFHQIIHKEQPYTFLFARPNFYTVDKRFQNVKIHKLGLNFLEWYVPKEKQRYK